jgi:cytochrome c5
VSKQDDHFFNTFSVVIGGLVALAIVLLALARSIGNPFEEAKKQSDAEIIAQVAERTSPVGRVAIAGQDNSALQMTSASDDSTANASALPVPKNAEETFKTVCSTCHGAGIGGAPKAGDHAAWAARIAQGKPTLYEHAIKGFQGKNGVMPAKGGRADLPDDLIKETVDYVVKLAQ